MFKLFEKPQTRLRLILEMVLTAFFLFLVFLVAPSEPKFLSDIGSRQVDVPADAALAVTFTKPVSTRSLYLNVIPETSGEWKFDSRIVTTSAVFVPSAPLKPSTEYKIVVLGTRNFISKIRTREREFSFITQGSPNLIAGSGFGEVKRDFPTDGHLALIFEKNPASRALVVRLDPHVANSIKVNGTVATVFFEEELKQSTEYTYYLLDQNIEEDDKTIASGTFVTVSPPKIVSMSPVGSNKKISSKISIAFETQMNKRSVEENFKVSPAVDGRLSWKNDQELIFDPAKLKYGTKYTYSLGTGVKTKNGGRLKDSITGSFTTYGAVKVKSVRPRNGSRGISTANSIRVTFDQPVDHASAEQRISFSPLLSGKFSWTGNTAIFKPSKKMRIGTRYVVTVKSGIEAEHGLPFPKTKKYSFTTRFNSVLLKVPVYYQTYALSCEESSLRAALAYRGIYRTDWQILQRVGYDPRSRVTSTNTWDDPRDMFVGSVTGRQNTTGYGVHWAPIAKAARSYGRGAKAFTGGTVQQLASEISAGNPVIIWGIFGYGKRDSWNVPGGGKVSTAKGEHTRTVVGFTGTVSNPTSFTIIDPLAGRFTWSTSTLKGNWGWWNNAGVVIY